MRTSLHATFANASDARKVIGAFLDHGADSDDITLLINHPDDKPEAGLADSYEEEVKAEHGITTTTAKDAAAGAAKGAGVGLGLGSLAILASLAVPGVGLVMGGGALAAAIAGAVGTTAAGAVAGGVAGYLKDQGIPDEAVTRIASTYSEGGALISVALPSGSLELVEAESLIAKYAHSDIWIDGQPHAISKPVSVPHSGISNK